MHYKCIITLVVMLVVSPFVNAQHLQRVPLSTQNYLTTPTASCVTIDDEGYLWIGTAEGLFRSDGYHVYSFRLDENPNLLKPSNSVTRLVDDHNGHLWVGTTQGLYYVDLKHDYQVQHFDSPYNSGNVSTITVNDDKTLWVAVGNNILQIRNDGTLLRRIECTWHGDGYKWVCDIKKGHDGKIYVAQCHGGLCSVDMTSNRLIDLPYESTFEPQTMVLDVKRKGMWIGSWGGGLLWYNGRHTVPVSVISATGTNESVSTYGNSSMIISLQLSFTGDTLWATTMKGLEAYSIREKGLLSPIDLSSLELPSDNLILSLVTMDKRTHDIWVAGCNPTTFAIHTSRILPHSDVVNCVTDVDEVCYSNPYVYTWHNRKGLTVLRQRDNVVLTNLYDGIHTVDAFLMTSDNAGGCYFGRTSINGNHSVISHVGVRKVNSRNQQVRVDSICSIEGSITALYYVAATQTLWVATDNGMWRIYGKRPTHAFSTYGVNCITVCNGQLYLGTEQGLMVVNSAGNNVQMLCSGAIKSITTQSDTCLWAGTSTGQVLRVGRDGVPQKQKKAVMPNGGSIYHIEVDSLGHVWTQSTRYLCEYAPKTQRQRVLSANHAMIDMTYINALSPMAGGVLVGGVGGFLTRVESSKELEKNIPLRKSRIKVSLVQTDSLVRPLSSCDSLLTVKAGTSSVILHLTTLNHISPQSETYAYRLRLAGSSDNGVWTVLPSGQNLIYLSTLPHGRWIVEAKVADKEHVWSAPCVVMEIESLPFWWQTWWAKMLAVMMVILATWGGLKLWQHTSHLRALYLNAIEKRYRVYLQSVETLVADTSENNQDFMQRAVATVEQHIADTDYNVEALASDMCMSRMTLYRRLHQQTGKSPSDFIRFIRLKYAARIIKDYPNKSIADIAAATGFSCPTVFRRQFKAMFGVTPSEYQRTKM